MRPDRGRGFVKVARPPDTERTAEDTGRGWDLDRDRDLERDRERDRDRDREWERDRLLGSRVGSLDMFLLVGRSVGTPAPALQRPGYYKVDVQRTERNVMLNHRACPVPWGVCMRLSRNTK
jgi:hypothetical protein